MLIRKNDVKISHFLILEMEIFFSCASLYYHLEYSSYLRLLSERARVFLVLFYFPLTSHLIQESSAEFLLQAGC